MKLYQKNPEFYKNVFTLAIPIALQSLITVGINMLDTIMIGKLEGIALSATSCANSFISIYQILCMGLGMGASVLVSRYCGILKSKNGNKKDAEYALKQTICLMLRLTIILATLFALATLLFPELLMKMYTKNEPVINLGVKYFKWSVLTYFFLGTSLTTTIVLRSLGQIKFPLFVSIGAFFINLIANYAFIFGKLGAPRMEIEGAALGTLISRFFEASMILGFLFFKDKTIQFKIKNLFMNTNSLIGEYIKICIPVLISDGILALGNNSVAMVIGRLDEEFMEANSITSVTQQLSTVVIQGICQAGAIITGKTLGKDGKEKAQNQAWLFLGLGIALGIVSALFITLISDTIIARYNITKKTVEITKELMLSISFIIIFQATNSIMTKGVLRGGGDTKMLMLADNIFLWIISIPLGILAGFVFKWPAFWIYFCLKFDQIVKTIWCIGRLKSEKWIKSISTGKKS